jgi:glutaredoxin 3
MAAKRLLGDKGVAFDEIDLFAEPKRRSEMIARARGGRSVPQIFVGDKHIGGFNEIYELDQSGTLDPMLAGG